MTELSYEERARREKLPIPYEIFKGIKGKFGVLALELREAYSNDPVKISKPTGIVFLHMTPTVGPNQYDWQSKISMKLGLPDIPKILLYLRNPSKMENCYLIHDRGMSFGRERGQDTTTLTINKYDGKDSFFWNIEKKENGQSVNKFSVPVSQEEAVIISILLQAAIPAMLSWSPPVKPLLQD